MTEADFKEWEARQPLRFNLVDGKPTRLAEATRGPSRLARVRSVAESVWGSRENAATWLAAVNPAIGGLVPEILAAESEEGCELVLRELVLVGRQREAARG